MEEDGYAYGDFFEHIEAIPPFGAPGDINLDTVVNGDGTGLWEVDDVTAFIDGWKTTATCRKKSVGRTAT